MDLILQLGPKGYFIIFDICVIILALFANVCVMLAISKCHFNLSGYRRFLISLTASDIYVCLINISSIAFQIFNSAKSSAILADFPYFNCGANVLRTLHLAGFFTNLLNLCGMSVDHFFGILYPIKYRYYMDKNIAKFSVVAIWLLSFALAFMDIPINVVLYQSMAISNDTQSSASVVMAASSARTRNDMPLVKRASVLIRDYEDEADGEFLPFGAAERSHQSLHASTRSPKLTTISKRSSKSKISAANLARIFVLLQEEVEAGRKNQSLDACTFYHDTKMWFEICIIGLAILCWLFLTICYSVIIRKITGNELSGRRASRKLTLTTAMLLGAFMICWVPFITFELIMLIFFQRGSGERSSTVDNRYNLSKLLVVQNVLNSLLMMYPLIDPIIYAARIPAVQQCFILFFTRKCCFCCIRFLSPSNQISFLLTAARVSKTSSKYDMTRISMTNSNLFLAAAMSPSSSVFQNKRRFYHSQTTNDIVIKTAAINGSKKGNDAANESSSLFVSPSPSIFYNNKKDLSTFDEKQ